MNHLPRAALAIALALSLVPLAGCEDQVAIDAAAAVENDKKARATAATELAEPVALMAVYLPQLHPVDKEDKYAPERHLDLDKTAEHAADEIRHAANFTKQKLQRNETEGVKPLIAALRDGAAARADAKEPAHFDKCEASVKALDGALEKAQASNATAGVTAKLPRVGPEAITEKAKQAIAPLLNARGPGPVEKAFIAKRSDASATTADVLSACQAALAEAEMTAGLYERRDDALRWCRRPTRCRSNHSATSSRRPTRDRKKSTSVGRTSRRLSARSPAPRRRR